MAFTIPEIPDALKDEALRPRIEALIERRNAAIESFQTLANDISDEDGLDNPGGLSHADIRAFRLIFGLTVNETFLAVEIARLSGATMDHEAALRWLANAEISVENLEGLREQLEELGNQESDGGVSTAYQWWSATVAGGVEGLLRWGSGI